MEGAIMLKHSSDFRNEGVMATANKNPLYSQTGLFTKIKKV